MTRQLELMQAELDALREENNALRKGIHTLFEATPTSVTPVPGYSIRARLASLLRIGGA